MQKLHGPIIHNVPEALPDSFQPHGNALVQLEGQHVLVVLPPIGVSHPYLTTLWYEIFFWRQAIATAEGQA